LHFLIETPKVSLTKVYHLHVVGKAVIERNEEIVRMLNVSGNV